MRRESAFSVISLDNSHFDIEYVEFLLRLAERLYHSFYIIMADELYSYNVPISEKYATTLERSKSKRVYVENAISRLQINSVCVKSRRWSSFCTPQFARILRKIYLLYSEDKDLSSAIETRLSYLIPKQRLSSMGLSSAQISARCVAYILEETAMAAHISGNYNLVDEYYPGDTAPVLKVFYDICDRKNLYQSIGIRPRAKRFWNVTRAGGPLGRNLEWTNKAGRLFATEHLPTASRGA